MRVDLRYQVFRYFVISPPNHNTNFYRSVARKSLESNKDLGFQGAVKLYVEPQDAWWVDRRTLVHRFDGDDAAFLRLQGVRCVVMLE